MMVIQIEQQEAAMKANISGLYKLHNNHDTYLRHNDGRMNSDDDSGTRLGIILGTTFAVLIVLLFAIAACFLIARRKRKKKKSGWTKEVSGASDGNASFNDNTSSLVVEYVDQPISPAEDEEQQIHDYDSAVPGSSNSSNRASTSRSPSPNQDTSGRGLLSHHISSPQNISASEPLQTASRDSASQSSPPHPTVTVISPPQPTDTPRESSETASGSFDRPPWNRNSRFQEFF